MPTRLPAPVTTCSDCLPGELLQLQHHLESTRISSSEVSQWTEKDRLLSRVKRFVTSGWPSVKLDREFQPYLSRQLEISLFDGCLLWGSRLIIPPPGRSYLLEQLHQTHLGVSRMKSLARGYVWWPDMDTDIENYVRRCDACQSSRPQPPIAPTHSWEVPKQPWSRIHLDFAGPFMGAMFLVLVDACTKWLDVVIMSSITSAVTIDKLQNIFATHGLPRTIVTDNGASFTSSEFQRFCRSNGIQHLTSSPYHPSTNGLAERAVQTFKQGLKRMEGGTLQSKLSRYLFRYRITPHTTTGLSPAELLMGRRPRSMLDLVHPDVTQRVENRQHKQVAARQGSSTVRSFQVGDNVFIRDFRGPGVKWLPGEIARVTGPLSYQVTVDAGLVRRHVDHVRLRHSEGITPLETTVDEEVCDVSWPPAASSPSEEVAVSVVPEEMPAADSPVTESSLPTSEVGASPQSGNSGPSESPSPPPVGGRRSVRRPPVTRRYPPSRNRPPPDYFRGGT